MSLTAITLVQNLQLPNAVAAQYTCPANGRVIIRHVVFCNTDTGARAVTAHIVPSGGSPAAATELMSALSVAAGTSYVSPELSGCVLNPGDSLQCFADTGAKVSMNANGIQQT